MLSGLQFSRSALWLLWIHLLSEIITERSCWTQHRYGLWHTGDNLGSNWDLGCSCCCFPFSHMSSGRGEVQCPLTYSQDAAGPGCLSTLGCFALLWRGFQRLKKIKLVRKDRPSMEPNLLNSPQKAQAVGIHRPFMQHPLHKSRGESSWQYEGISPQINPCHRAAVTEKAVCSQLFNFATFCTSCNDISLLWSDSSRTTMQLSAGKEISDVMINKIALT